jgi:hypothetical protein
MTETRKQEVKQAARDLPGQAYIPGNGDMGYEERRVYQGRNNGMAGNIRSRYSKKENILIKSF